MHYKNLDKKIKNKLKYKCIFELYVQDMDTVYFGYYSLWD